MLPLSFRGCLRRTNKTRRTAASRRGTAKLRSIPWLERLEDRTTPSTVTWINSGGGDWDTPSNWSDGSVNRVPGASDDAVIPSLSAGASVIHAGFTSNDSVHSVTTSAPIRLSGGSLTTSGITINSATITVGVNGTLTVL